MKKFLLLICLLFTSYAGASFDGQYFCGDSSFVFIEINGEMAGIEFLNKKKSLVINDAILFNHQEDLSFEIKAYKGSQLEILTFSIDKDVLTMDSSDDKVICERVITRRM